MYKLIASVPYINRYIATEILGVSPYYVDYATFDIETTTRIPKEIIRPGGIEMLVRMFPPGGEKEKS